MKETGSNQKIKCFPGGSWDWTTEDRIIDLVGISLIINKEIKLNILNICHTGCLLQWLLFFFFLLICGAFSWRRKWQSTPAFLLGESQGQRSLVGYKEPQRLRLVTHGVTKSQTQLSYWVRLHVVLFTYAFSFFKFFVVDTPQGDLQ